MSSFALYNLRFVKCLPT